MINTKINGQIVYESVSKTKDDNTNENKMDVDTMDDIDDTEIEI